MNITVSKKPDISTFKSQYPTIDVVVDVSDEGSLFLHSFYQALGVTYFWFPMSERWSDIGINSLFGALTILHDCDRKNKHVLLHCVQGQNRSVTVFEAYQFMQTGDETNLQQLLWNTDGARLPKIDVMISFLTRMKEYMNNKSLFPGAPLDWCKTPVGS